MKSITKIFATLLVVMLMMVNFNVEYSLAPIELQVGVEMNSAEAEPFEADMKLMTETCWTTGKTFKICRDYPPYFCDVGAQGYCGTPE